VGKREQETRARKWIHCGCVLQARTEEGVLIFYRLKNPYLSGTKQRGGKEKKHLAQLEVLPRNQRSATAGKSKERFHKRSIGKEIDTAVTAGRGR